MGTFIEQFGDPAAGLAMARESLTRLGAQPLLARLEAAPAVATVTAQVAATGTSSDRPVNV